MRVCVAHRNMAVDAKLTGWGLKTVFFSAGYIVLRMHAMHHFSEPVFSLFLHGIITEISRRSSPSTLG